MPGSGEDKLVAPVPINIGKDWSADRIAWVNGEFVDFARSYFDHDHLLVSTGCSSLTDDRVQDHKGFIQINN